MFYAVDKIVLPETNILVNHFNRKIVEKVFYGETKISKAD